MRIVDDDSGFIVVVDDDDGGGGGLRIVGFVVDKTTADGCLLRDKCEELTKGFADDDKDGFLRRWPPPPPPPIVLSYRWR